MRQLQVEQEQVHEISLYVVRPARNEGKAVIFYHGWSSSAKRQISRAMWMATYGYTVFLPDAIHHGKRGALEKYFEPEAYPYFWETLVHNGEEYPILLEMLQKEGFSLPYLVGHSMGGLSVLGIGARYPKEVKGVVSFNGSGDWELTHLFTQARFGIVAPRDETMENVLRYWTPIAHVEKMKDIPMLLTNGEIDHAVDPRAQSRFFSKLEKVNSVSRHLIYPGLGHFVTTQMMEDALSFMESLE